MAIQGDPAIPLTKISPSEVLMKERKKTPKNSVTIRTFLKGLLVIAKK